MAQTPREVVNRCLKYETPERIPRDLWTLPWANIHYPQELEKIQQRFPNDFTTVDYFYTPNSKVKGDEWEEGYYTDEWGCTFKNIQKGVIGEIETPIIAEISDWKSVEPPYEQLPTNNQVFCDTINRFYDKTDLFVFANICPRPWERYQFLRGTENAMMDVMFPEEGGKDLLRVIHEFYLKEMELWIKTDVDAINFMDDWGTQNQLLIPPKVWRELFKPLYKDYCDLAKAHGKFIFMHSDGHISEIYEDLVEVGVDAINSQLFCMDMEDLEKRVKGKITFWGEIDRQHILPSKNPQDGRDAVKKVVKNLHDPKGGIIAQLEFGVGANPETVYAVFDEWEKIE